METETVVINGREYIPKPQLPVPLYRLGQVVVHKMSRRFYRIAAPPEITPLGVRYATSWYDFLGGRGQGLLPFSPPHTFKEEYLRGLTDTEKDGLPAEPNKFALMLSMSR